MKSSHSRSASAPYFSTIASGVTTLPLLLDIFWPSLGPDHALVAQDRERFLEVDQPGVEHHLGPHPRVQQMHHGVLGAADVEVDRQPVIRQRVAIERTVGCQCGEAKRRKYHDEQAKPSSVSVSRSAGPPHLGQVVLTNSGTLASGERPVPEG